MLRVGLPELIVIFLVVYLLFGPKALSDVARTFGRFLRQFQDGLQNLQRAVDEPPSKRTSDSPKTTAEPTADGEGKDGLQPDQSRDGQEGRPA